MDLLIRLVALVLTLTGLAGPFGASRAQAQGTGTQGAANGAVEVAVGCGADGGAICAKVVPALAAKTARMGIDLKPVAGAGASALCERRIAAAILPRTGLPKACRDAVEVTGPGLFPLYAILLVRTGTGWRHMDDLARDGARRGDRAGGARHVASPPGDAALMALLAADPAWKAGIMPAPWSDAGRVGTGEVDGVFALASLDHPLLSWARAPLRFLDIHPPPDLFRMGADGCAWRVTALDFGAGAPVTTIATDAVLVLDRGLRDAHARGGPKVSEALAQAIPAAREAVLAATRSPPGWRPEPGPCHDGGSPGRN